MISDVEIERKAVELDVSPQNVERDYVHGWLLKHIYEHPALASQLVLKGGNGIRKAYLAGARYSMDLDFSTACAIDQRDLYENLQGVLIAASTSSNVHFSLDRTRVDAKRLTIPGIQATEARISCTLLVRKPIDAIAKGISYDPLPDESLRRCHSTRYAKIVTQNGAYKERKAETNYTLLGTSSASNA